MKRIGSEFPQRWFQRFRPFSSDCDDSSQFLLRDRSDEGQTATCPDIQVDDKDIRTRCISTICKHGLHFSDRLEHPNPYTVVVEAAPQFRRPVGSRFKYVNSRHDRIRRFPASFKGDVFRPAELTVRKVAGHWTVRTAGFHADSTRRQTEPCARSPENRD